MRATLPGLPPAWIGVGDADLFHAEDIDWAEPLRDAGVETILDVVPGSYPSAKYLRPHAPVMVAFRASMLQALQQGLAGSDDKGRDTP